MSQILSVKVVIGMLVSPKLRSGDMSQEDWSVELGSGRSGRSGQLEIARSLLEVRRYFRKIACLIATINAGER